MARSEKDTRTDALINRLKNDWLLASVIVAFLVIGFLVQAAVDLEGRLESPARSHVPPHPVS